MNLRANAFWICPAGVVHLFVNLLPNLVPVTCSGELASLRKALQICELCRIEKSEINARSNGWFTDSSHNHQIEGIGWQARSFVATTLIKAMVCGIASRAPIKKPGRINPASAITKFMTQLEASTATLSLSNRGRDYFSANFLLTFILVLDLLPRS
jgi:hypothetical protein